MAFISRLWPFFEFGKHDLIHELRGFQKIHKSDTLEQPRTEAVVNKFSKWLDKIDPIASEKPWPFF